MPRSRRSRRPFTPSACAPTATEAIRQIRQAQPEARILVLASFAERAEVQAAMLAGALGYLLKVAPPEDLLHVIRSVYQGTLSLPRELAQAFTQRTCRTQAMRRACSVSPSWRSQPGRRPG